jgi:hypothetical protein
MVFVLKNYYICKKNITMQSKYDFPRYTYNDYKNWKEDWELIDGYPINLLPSATMSHNKAQIRFMLRPILQQQFSQI